MKKKVYDWEKICILVNEVRDLKIWQDSKYWIEKLESIGCPKGYKFFKFFKDNWMESKKAGKTALFTIQRKDPVYVGTFSSKCTAWIMNSREESNKTAKASLAKRKAAAEENSFPKPEDNPTLLNAIDELNSRGFILQEGEIRQISSFNDDALVSFVKMNGYRVFQVKKEEV